MQNKETDQCSFRDEDIFYDYFKKNLENHQLPVDEKCWESISECINPKKRNILYMFLYLGAAAIAILLISVHVFKTDLYQNELFTFDNIEAKVKNRIEYKSSRNIAKLYNKQNDLACVTDLKSEIIIKNKRDKAMMPSHKAIVNTKEESETLYSNTTKEDKVTEGTIEDSIPKKKMIDNLNMYTGNDNLLLAAYEPKKENNKWELGTSLITGVTQLGFPKENNLIYVASPCAKEEPVPSYKAISDVAYAPPFSVGVQVRKKLNNTFSLETGLIYSYLSTTYKDIDKQYYSAELKLHYVGIPVNLVANIVNITPKWKLYASTGVMAEKGIRSELSKYVYKKKATITQVESIKGLQWSLKASVGLSYSFYKDWNIYIEPHASYYFNNNQPLSIRTEKQTILGVNAGFRYEF